MDLHKLTWSPIKTLNIRSVSAASSTEILFKKRRSGSIVVSHNCCGIISPSPYTKTIAVNKRRHERVNKCDTLNIAE